jgi:hypothetical protein
MSAVVLVVVWHRDPMADGAGDGYYSRKEAQQLVDCEVPFKVLIMVSLHLTKGTYIIFLK